MSFANPLENYQSHWNEVDIKHYGFSTLCYDSMCLPAYEVISDREERDGEADAKAAMRIIEVTQPGMDSEARWVRKGGESVFDYKQYICIIDSNDNRRTGIRLSGSMRKCGDTGEIFVYRKKARDTNHCSAQLSSKANQKFIIRRL